MRVALLGYGNVARAFARLLESKRHIYPFLITGIHTRSHGTALDQGGLGLQPAFSKQVNSVDEFLERAQPAVLIEITTLNPASGEPAISNIRKAFARGIHVVTANKGPIAHAYAELRSEAEQAQVKFRFESTVMDGTPVFNNFRNNLPEVNVLGFRGALNSTSKVVVSAMARGLSLEDGVKEAQTLGIAEADASFDIDGWDAAAKTAALANVLMNAKTTPQNVERCGIRDYTPEKIRELAAAGKTVVLVSRGERTQSGLRLQAKAEVLPFSDPLAMAKGATNFLLVDTELMGTLGTLTVNPGVEQTAYGLFSDLVEVAKSI